MDDSTDALGSPHNDTWMRPRPATKVTTDADLFLFPGQRFDPLAHQESFIRHGPSDVCAPNSCEDSWTSNHFLYPAPPGQGPTLDSWKGHGEDSLCMAGVGQCAGFVDGATDCAMLTYDEPFTTAPWEDDEIFGCEEPCPCDDEACEGASDVTMVCTDTSPSCYCPAGDISAAGDLPPTSFQMCAPSSERDLPCFDQTSWDRAFEQNSDPVPMQTWTELGRQGRTLIGDISPQHRVRDDPAESTEMMAGNHNQLPPEDHQPRIPSPLSASTAHPVPRKRLRRLSTAEEKPRTKQASPKTKSQVHDAACELDLTCNWLVLINDGTRSSCGLIFISHVALHAHLVAAHVGPPGTRCSPKIGGYPCLWNGCTRKLEDLFPQRAKLERHVLTHSRCKPYHCEWIKDDVKCRLHFSSQAALDQHERTHTGKRPFECRHKPCTKIFTHVTARTMHERTHTGEKPLKCDVCDKCFSESSGLSKHKKIHLAPSSHTCTVCQKSFHRPHNLRRHEKTHGDPKSLKTSSSSLSKIPTMETLATSFPSTPTALSPLPNPSMGTSTLKASASMTVTHPPTFPSVRPGVLYAPLSTPGPHVTCHQSTGPSSLMPPPPRPSQLMPPPPPPMPARVILEPLVTDQDFFDFYVNDLSVLQAFNSMPLQ